MEGEGPEASAVERGAVAPRPDDDADRMDEMKLESLKARVRGSDYVVDPQAVAEAIVRRWMAARDARAARARARGRGPVRQGVSPDVFEAR
jgi:hypothetical protein